MMKLCKQCKIEKDILLFNKDKHSKDGYCYTCSECQKIKYHLNKDNKLKRQRERYLEKRHEILERQKAYNMKNKVSRYKYRKDHYSRNKDAALSYWSKRRAIKLNATPKWLTKDHFEEIKDFYTAAVMFKLYTGVEYQVDHIVPLQGKNVCGLHVPWNLCILTESENKRKGNSNIF
jgi:hypothetical protein